MAFIRKIQTRFPTALVSAVFATVLAGAALCFLPTIASADKTDDGDAVPPPQIAHKSVRAVDTGEKFGPTPDLRNIAPSELAKLRKGAEQGDAGAQYSLGLRCLHSQDYVEAAKWFRKAAEHGTSEAQHNSGYTLPNREAQGALGTMYERGQGVKQDYAEAYFWRSLAAYGARRLDAIAKHLTPEQIATVRRRIQEWNPPPTVAK